MPQTRRLAALLAVALLLSACGGGDTAEETAEGTATDVASSEEAPTEDTPTEAPTTEEATEEPTEEADGGGVKAAPTLEPNAAPTLPPAPPPPPPAAPAPPPPPPAPAATEAMSDIGAEMDTGGASTYDSYTVITDDTGAIALEVPSEWSDVDGRPYNDEQGRQLYDVRASSDLQAFTDTWDVPGVIVTASTEVAQSENEVTLLDEAVGPLSQACTYIGRQPYDDGLYTGQVDIYESCGGTDTGYVVLGAVPDSRAFVIRVQVQVVEERDLEALAQALNTFVITGDV